MQYWINTNKLRLLSLFLILSYFSQAQENSPYTRYGLGNNKQIENVANRLMGGIAIADKNPLIVNPANPASYADLRLTSYNLGVDASRNSIKTTSGSNQTGYATIMYATVGIAAGKGFGLSFGLLPQYNARYNMQKIDTLFGKYERTNNYYGGGSIQRIYAGAAYKYKDFSVGFNTGYTFGNLINSSEAEFVDSQKILYNHNYGRISVGGIFGQLGIQYSSKLKDEYRLNFGASYTIKQRLRGNKEQHYETYIGDITDPLYNYRGDSLYNKKGNINIPATLSLGAALNDGDYWMIGLDYVSTNWTNFRSYEMTDSTGSSWYIRLGGAITPDGNNKSYWKRVSYRAGAYTGQDIYAFNGNSLKKSAITFGLGMPIRRITMGQINMGFELGVRGTTKNNLLQENFTRFIIGVTLNDKWFVKRKYD